MPRESDMEYRMRRTIMIGVLLGIIAAGAAAAWYSYRLSAGAVRPAELLPEDTLAMIEAVDLKESLDEFRAGPLGKAVSGIDMPACMGAFNADPEEIERVSRLQAGVKAAVDSPWFDMLFGDLAVIAVLKPEEGGMKASSEEMWRASALVVVQPKKPVEMIHALGKMFARNVTVSSQNAGDIRIDRVETEEGPPLFVAVHRGLGLMALDPKPIVRCLAPRESDGGGRRSLAASAAYAASRKDLNQAESGRFFAWIDLHDILNSAFAPAGSSEAADITTAVGRQQWGGFNQAQPVIAAVVTDDGEVMHHRWRVLYNADELPSDIARMLAVPPEINRTLSWMPETVLYYGWQNNLGQVLETLAMPSGGDAGKAAEFKRSFAAVTGTEFEEAVKVFGSQCAVLIRDIKTGGLFPVPELALMAELRQPGDMDRIVETVLRNLDVSIKTVEYHGASIRYIALPYGEDISPSYARRDGFMVVASSRGLLESLLWREEGQAGLAGLPLFDAVGKRLSEPGNQVAFIQPAVAAARAKNLLSWGLSLAVMAGKAGDAQQMVYLSNKVVEPILDGLSKYRAVGARTVFQKNRIDSDIYILKPQHE